MASGISLDGNLLLKSLRREDQALLTPHFEALDLPRGARIVDAGRPVTHVVFPVGSMVTGLIVAMADGRSAVAAAIGREGAVGAAAREGAPAAFTNGIAMLAGPALRIETGRLQEVRQSCEALDWLLLRYEACLLAQTLQYTACNALHPIEQRTMRWLLTLQSRVGGDMLPLTQDVLAGMIGVQRTYLTRILQTLQKQGLVAITRGRLRIADRSGLKRAACPCHGHVMAHYDAAMGAVYDLQGNCTSIGGSPARRERPAGGITAEAVSG